MTAPFGIVCFGRGIEKVQGVWQPTAYLERRTENGQHSGWRTEDLYLDSDDERVIVAGGHANVMAMTQLWQQQVRARELPELLIWAAGRPEYLAAEPEDLSEGSVLFVEFKKRLEGCDRLRNHLPTMRVEIQTKNRNTYDDLLQSLEIAHGMHLKKIVIVSVLVHLQRIAAFLEQIRKTKDHLNNIAVELAASELVLLGRWFLSGAQTALAIGEDIGPLDHLALSHIIESPAYRRTAAREAKGVADIKAGCYGLSTP